MITDRVEASVFARGAPVVVSGGETVSSTSGGDAVVVSVVRVGAAKEVEVETRASVVSVTFRGGAAGVVEPTPGIWERVVAHVVTSCVVAAGTDAVVGVA